MKLSLIVASLLASTSAATSTTHHQYPRAQSGNDTTPTPFKSVTRIRLNPAGVRDYGDTDYSTCTVPNAAITNFTSSSGNGSGLSFTLSASNGKLSGTANKAVYTRIISSLGERVVGAGISAQSDAGGGAMILTVSGLSAGQHSISAWHNAWDKLNETAALSVSVDGKVTKTDVRQSVRVDNIWEAANSYVTFEATEGKDVEVVYTPSRYVGGRVFLNGFEIDGPSMENQISFPAPAHRDERVGIEDGNTVEVSWRAAKAEYATYDVYLGTEPTGLQAVAQGLQ